jgi:hypothetical protein
MTSDLGLRHGEDLVRVVRKLKALDDKKVLAQFRAELRIAGKPLVPAVRASIRRIPSKRPYSAAGLRGQMSKATNMQVKTTGRQASVIIRVDGRKMPAKAKAVQSYMEGVKPRWRHPVFGNREVWVQQPAQPYFFAVMRTAGPLGRAAVGRVMDKFSKDLT